MNLLLALVLCSGLPGLAFLASQRAVDAESAPQWAVDADTGQAADAEQTAQKTADVLEPASHWMAKMELASREYRILGLKYQAAVQREMEAPAGPPLAGHIEFIRQQLDWIDESRAAYQELVQRLESATKSGAEAQAGEPPLALEVSKITRNSARGSCPLIGFCCDDCENAGILKIRVDHGDRKYHSAVKHVLIKREAAASFNELVRDRGIKLSHINYSYSNWVPVLVYFQNQGDSDIICDWFRGLPEDWKQCR